MFCIFPRTIKKSECRKILKYCIKNTKFKEANILKWQDVDDGSRNDPKVRKTDVGFITDKDNKVNEIAWFYLKEANKIQFKYDLKYFQSVQFARYRNGGHYDWHKDSSGINSYGETRKLSLTFSLSDPKTYEGGYLEFYNGGRPMKDMELSDGRKILGSQIREDIRDQGSVIVFDSNDFHRVTPVTKGTRYSLVCWTVGPNFR